MESMSIIKAKCDERNFKKLEALNNKYLNDFIAKFVNLFEPDSIFICNDTDEDLEYIRNKALKDGEESKLAVNGHTIHFDSIHDQARDKARTKFLVPAGKEFGKGLNTADKAEGIEEINNIMSQIMKGRELLILFFTLGPADSPFTIPAVQLTDSSYVVHSETILYRKGYQEFKRLGDYDRFFKFAHSEGELENAVSKNVNKRRIYIDTEENIVYSMNTQYGGNTIGLKKLAMRLGINRASEEDWLTEHMFIVGINGPGQRVTYFAGAFPSMCGKTSTAMLKGETIVGDDIVYIRNLDGKAKAVNVEVGLFGIIQDINPDDDPMIWKILHEENEVIFSNVLKADDGKVYWIGKPGELPEKGINYSGEWRPGKKDADGNEIPPSHKNARFTAALKDLENIDPRFDDPDGIQLGGIIYGGRDSDTWVPVQEAYGWTHGIVAMGASIESETTAATLGKTGVKTFNPMSNLDFLSISMGKYVDINIEFGKKLQIAPKIFSVNYFLKDKESGKFLNAKLDKLIWLKWMELRVNDDVDAIDAGTGYIPKYEDLSILFKKYLDKDYSEQEYIQQFTIRVSENIEKTGRIIDIYKNVGPEVPGILFETLKKQKEKLQEMLNEKGPYISPLDL
ncbi:MAG: phosphoenolpyruvate carboxykinase (GTP) [Actinomycetota bacterium]|nr:MAG: phosphoenolpyruvate carboxykinase (GTP) [Actinomycetota bacterium]